MDIVTLDPTGLY
ncbi:tarsal-less isoform 1A [Bombyx mori]|uniref:Tal-like protein 1A n=1 Tax=Bombyx mori TaxID=7091 RepID=A3RLR2_BOMMO|nr:tarsal-less isoform 1A [Bombyx mori]ABO09845.1 tal-like protein 1A [Bombyx mori]